MDPSVKRYKVDPDADPVNPDPSPVVHVRKLSSAATEADLLEALQHFGRISYVSVKPNRHMALVEFEDPESAKQCVQYGSNNSIYVAGETALFNFSTSKFIQRFGLESEKPNNIVCLTVYNAVYPINVDTINTICKPHGEIRKICILRRQQLQVLVEFENIDAAKRAKVALNGADIYSDCCTIKIEFAKADMVRITNNSPDQWDFTCSGGGEPEMRKSLLGAPQGAAVTPYSSAPQHQQGMGYGGQGAGGYGTGGYGSGGGYGGQGGYGSQPSYGMYPGANMHGGGGGGRGGTSVMGMGPQGGMGGGPQPVVIMLYGIDHEHFNCDKIFNLLCVYGNVNKVKLMKTKEDTAMIEIMNYEQADQVMRFLSGIEIFETKLTFRKSNQQNLQDPTREPFPLPDGTPSFADYRNSRNNRFSTPALASKNRMVEPNCSLHFYNSPPNLTEDSVKQIFQDRNAPIPMSVTVFSAKSERSSTGALTFETPKAAAEAVVLANHTSLPSPSGRAPFIFKLAFAADSKKRDFRGDPTGAGNGAGVRGPGAVGQGGQQRMMLKNEF